MSSYLGDRQTPILRRCDERYRQCRQAGNWPLDEQSGGELAPAISTTRTSHATLPQHAKFAEICRRSCLRLQSFQPGARALQQKRFQAQPCRRSRRVAPTLFSISSGIQGHTETGSHLSDTARQPVHGSDCRWSRAARPVSYALQSGNGLHGPTRI